PRDMSSSLVYLSLFPAAPLSPSDLSTLSLHDALPIFTDAFLAAYAIENNAVWLSADRGIARFAELTWRHPLDNDEASETPVRTEDRKSTRLNSSHVSISYAVFCLKKKKYKRTKTYTNT